MSKKRKNVQQLSFKLMQRAEVKGDGPLHAPRQKHTVVSFVDTATRAIREDAIKRVRSAGIFDRPSSKR